MAAKLDRKGFFKSYFCELLAGIDTAFGEELDGFAEKFPDLIRPPGACNENRFIELCSRCGNCVRSCPFFALKPVMMVNDFDRGTPTLRCGEAFCRFCEQFPCVTSCPTGALSTTNPEKLRKIATANCKAVACLRSGGSDCRACLNSCQESGYNAISITGDGPPSISPIKCSGCGACAIACPAYPDTAIILKPA